MRTEPDLRKRDWRAYGAEVMATVRDESRAKAICRLELEALHLDVRPDLERCEALQAEKNHRAEALGQQLYERHDPVSDLAMLGRVVGMCIVGVLFAIAVAASATFNGATFAMIGWPWSWAAVVGLLVTGIAIGAGHVLFARLLAAVPSLEVVFGLVLFGLFIWAVLDFADARTQMLQVAAAGSKVEAESFVDDDTSGASTAAQSDNDASTRFAVEAATGNGLMKIALAAELIVAVGFGLIVSLISDPDFVGWRELKRICRDIAKLKYQTDRLNALVATAERECAAGLLLGHRFGRPAPVKPLFKILPLILLAVLPAREASAQTNIKREEAILLDLSRSVGSDGGSATFREFLLSTRRLLETEPPNSRVYVLTIGADSFGGSLPVIVKGWTPSEGGGVFDDGLRKARQQLVSAFQAKGADLKPTARATDLTGGLWRAKTLLESDGPNLPKDVYVLSDSRQTASFDVLELLSVGSARALDQVQSQGQLVPLPDFNVRIFGIGTAGLTPQMWNGLKAFWTEYFRRAGSRLLVFSAEPSARRE